VLGRPFVYGTTRQFLEYFGLKSIDELPNIKEFSSLAIGKTQGESVKENNIAGEEKPSPEAEEAQAPAGSENTETREES